MRIAQNVKKFLQEYAKITQSAAETIELARFTIPPPGTLAM